jgi:hypothetical protein
MHGSCPVRCGAAALKHVHRTVDTPYMTTTRTEGARARPAGPAKPPALSARRVGPVITMVAAVVGAVVMFGFGVLVGRVGASVAGLHDTARTGLMLGFGAAFGLLSAATSARRHMPRR